MSPPSPEPDPPATRGPRPSTTPAASTERGSATRPPAWLTEIPTTVGPPWLQMGTRAIDEPSWLLPDGQLAEELAEKRRLVATAPDAVGAWEAGTDAPGEEVRALVDRWLAVHAPWVPALDASGAAEDLGRHPLEVAALRIGEDLCLVDDPGGGHRLVAGSVCFPSHWVLAEKLGRPMAEVHGPVPHYAAELERRVDRFFDRLPSGRIVARRNLSIHDRPDLHRPGPADAFASDGSGPDGLWVRSERQTLRRLPRTGAILFTIRTQVCPVALLETLPEVAWALAARIEAHAAEATRSGSAHRAPPWLVGWLRQVGEPPGR